MFWCFNENQYVFSRIDGFRIEIVELSMKVFFSGKKSIPIKASFCSRPSLPTRAGDLLLSHCHPSRLNSGADALSAVLNKSARSTDSVLHASLPSRCGSARLAAKADCAATATMLAHRRCQASCADRCKTAGTVRHFALTVRHFSIV